MREIVRGRLAVLVVVLTAVTARAATVVLSNAEIASTNRQYEAFDVIVSNGTLTVDGAHAFASLSLRDGAVLTHPACTADRTSSLDLTVAGAVSIDAGCRIDVSGRGYLAGRTVGNTTVGAATGGSGGSYGGLGYPTGGGAANATYGNFAWPDRPGSGSGYGAGGGLIVLTAGSLANQGSIVADGYDGGSGGGIRIRAGTLAGTGAIQANGVLGWSGGAGGGGGRVALYYDTDAGFSFSAVTAHSGHEYGYGRHGSIGTVYFQHTGQPGELRIDSHGTDVALWTPLGVATDAVFQADHLVIAGTGVVAAAGHQMPIRLGELSVTNGGMLTHRPATADDTYWLDVTVRGVAAIAAGSRIDVTGRGYLAGRTVGNTTVGGATGGSGGSYGGLGYPTGGGAANATYGNFAWPEHPGSGSGGGPGGGLIILVAGSLVNHGSILANGEIGGSGGGIRIRGGTVTGTGVIQANAVDGRSGDGGGGGGRVALYYDTDAGFSFSAVTAHGGHEYAYGRHGSIGTVYFQHTGQSGELRIDSHGTDVALWTPLGVATDAVFQADRLVIAGTGVVAAAGHQMPIRLGELSVTNGGMLTHRPATADDTYWLDVTVRGVAAIAAGSRIDVTGRGYLAGRTVGNTTVGGATGGSGGSYGGLGYPTGFGGAANATYGNFAWPDHPGSGSGYGAGGGLIVLTAGSLANQGSVVADGYDGGSGGGIRIRAGTLAGTGAIQANGVLGWSGGAGGGGGRVALYYDTDAGFSFSAVTAHSGHEYGSGRHGSIGTVYFQHTGQPDELRIDNHGTDVALWTPLGAATDTVLRVGRLVIAGTGVVAAAGHQMPIRLGELRVSNGGVLTHRPATATNEYSLNLAVDGAVRVDAASRIDVTGKGYLQGRTKGNTTEDGATGWSGGSYGGLGANVGGDANPVYGEAENPTDLGSGAGSAGNDGGAGGGLILLSAGAVTNDGIIAADGGGTAHAGSGGGIRLSVGTLAGTGTIRANGGTGAGWAGGGGGGRVAVYTWQANVLPPANVQALGGNPGNNAGAGGTVHFDVSPVCIIEQPDSDALFHGTEPVQWTALGMHHGAARVDVRAQCGGMTYPIALRQPLVGSAAWDTTQVPNGVFEVSAVALDLTGKVLTQTASSVLVNNSVVWHRGEVSSAENWTPGRVHVVESDVTLVPGGALTIEPGAIVKFAPGAGLFIEPGATLTAGGLAGRNVTLTAFPDDEVGGDTNLDGNRSWPRHGSWAGIRNEGGTLETNAFTVLRYLIGTHRGALVQNEIWSDAVLHRITGDLTVPGGAVLEIGPGAVVKFEPGTALNVQAGGRLVARGTAAKPVTFTSVRDDSIGGDSNADGEQTVPAAGDWRWVLLEGGAAWLDRCVLAYGGGPAEGGWGDPGGPGKAVIKTTAGATLSVSNCVVRDGFYDGLLIWGGMARVVNTVLTGMDRAICAHPGGNVTVQHCTLDDNRVGLLVHGGVLNAANTIVANSYAAGVLRDFGDDTFAISSSDVWSTNAASGNYAGTADRTGQNGNVAVDPRFRNRATGNYRLANRSPCIDAANGAVGPATDAAGAPRYDDPRIPNSGLASANGACPDMGAYEFVETAASDIDLIGLDVNGPAQAEAGTTVEVRWSVRNVKAGSFSGQWHDTILLVPEGAGLGSTPLEVAQLVSSGALGLGETISFQAQVRMPGGTEGNWRWAVRVNSGGEVFEGANWTNNTASSAAICRLLVPEIVVGGTAVARRFAAAGESHWFKFVPEAGKDIRVSLDSADNGGWTELFVARGVMPTRQNYDARSQELTADSSVFVGSAGAARCYVLAYARAVPTGSSTFQIGAAALDFSLSGINLSRVGNAGAATIRISGGQLRENMQYRLVSRTGGAISASSVFLADASQAFAAFNLVGQPAGVRDVQVVDGGRTSTLDNAVFVGDGNAGQIQISFSVPKAIRAGRIGTGTMEYRNVGDNDIEAPLLRISAGEGMTIGRVTPYGGRASSSLQVLAIAREGPAGILPPGAGGVIQFFFRQDNPSATAAEFTALASESKMSPVDWASAKANLRPAFVAADAWEAVWANFTASVGALVGNLNARLAEDATYLSGLGEYCDDADALISFEIGKAGLFGEIRQRYSAGMLGRGWPDWSMFLETNAQGQAFVHVGNTHVRAFSLIEPGNPWAGYEAAPGDYGVLQNTGERCQLRERDGELFAFRADGHLDYQEDRNGDRASRLYSGGRLAAISNAWGDVVRFSYNAQGRVARFTDSAGRTNTFTYDASGEHLLRIALADGTSERFTYVSGQGPGAEHALRTATDADGVVISNGYDAAGQLRAVFRNGERLQTFAGDPADGMVSNALGTGNRVSVNGAGQPARIADALGRKIGNEYDGAHQLTGISWPGGLRTRTAYGALGLPNRFVDALGNAVEAESETRYGHLLWIGRDRESPDVATAYDARGNPTSVTYPDGATERYAYDSRGSLTNAVNARGTGAHYTYDGRGRLIRVDYTGGARSEYAYDASDNLTLAVRTAGAAAFTNTFAYDARDRLTRTTDPHGRTLFFAYDAAGRRTNLTDRAGLNLTYAYDAAGRLAALVLAGGVTNTTYRYNAEDQLVRQEASGGIATAYEYDAAGQVTRILNTASNGAEISRFEYAYDSLGRRIRMTTAEGAWSYGYDAAGQLTSVTLPSGRAIVYQYDAAGNRTAVIDGGVAAYYSVNALNQYTVVGDATCAYDADGNLVSMAKGGTNWTYVYDAERHLVRAEGPDGVEEFVYDALGTRIATVRNGERTEYVTDPVGLGNVVAEYDGGGEVRARYLHGLGLATRLTPGEGACHYTFDAQGNTAELVESGGDRVVNRYRFLPFGERVSATETVTNPFQFAGQWGVMRHSSGVDYMRARYYRADLGRFLTRDPIGIAGGLNLYVYVANAPTELTDPVGLMMFYDDWLREVAKIAFRGSPDALTILKRVDPLRIGDHIVDKFKPALFRRVGSGVFGEKIAEMRAGRLMSRLYFRGYSPERVVQVLEKAMPKQGMSLVKEAVKQGAKWIVRNPVVIAKAGLCAGVAYGSYKITRAISSSTGLDEGVQTVAAWGMSKLWNLLYGAKLGSGRTRLERSIDPNDILGPAGYGEQHFVQIDQTMHYLIRFENKTNATAPAQIVIVTNDLAASLDWRTFQFGDMGFGRHVVAVPEGRTFYSVRTNLYATLGVNLDIEAQFDPRTGRAVWTFASLDPVTGGLPDDPYAGFLPPNTNPPCGEGWVRYSVRQATNTADTSRITARASIVFDVNEKIDTPLYTNTVDAALPSSSVVGLPPSAVKTVNVRWNGDDRTGAGVVSYDIWVNRDGGPFEVWLAGTTTQSAVFTGVVGSTYGFYSVARDGVGYSEIAPSGPDARVYVSPDRLYAARGGAHAFPFTNWVAAATNIQSAVNAAGDGAMVLVTDGVYEVTAPVAITNGVWVQSVNGPEETLVDARGRSGCAVVNHSNAVLEGFALMGGNADTGGGVRVGTRGGLVRYCVLTGNRARVGGGAQLAAGTLRNCLIAENAATDRGGGVALDAGAIESSTVAYNAATNAAGGVSAGAGALLLNAIVWNNRARSAANWQNAGGDAAWWYSCTTPSPGAGNNVTNAPGFVNGPAGDYRLADGSPCIDAGLNRDWMSGAVDLAGNERINNGTVDIGAYEAQGRPSLWVGSADLGGGWRRLDWFGAFWDPGSGWIYHAEHGWMYALADTTASIWFYTFDLGWLWSGSWAYPWLWRANDGAWLYYFRDTSPRAFYNVTTGQAEWH